MFRESPASVRSVGPNRRFPGRGSRRRILPPALTDLATVPPDTPRLSGSGMERPFPARARVPRMVRFPVPLFRSSCREMAAGTWSPVAGRQRARGSGGWRTSVPAAGSGRSMPHDPASGTAGEVAFFPLVPRGAVSAKTRAGAGRRGQDGRSGAGQCAMRWMRGKRASVAPRQPGACAIVLPAGVISR